MMIIAQVMYFCEYCQCAYEEGDCEGRCGFYEEPIGDINCPCCGDLIVVALTP